MKVVAVLMAAFLTDVMVNSQTALDKFATGNLLVTADMYETLLLKHPEENLIFSPLSVQIIMALIRAGAKGVTELEISTAMKFPDQKTTQDALGQLLPALDQKGPGLQISKANKIYLGEDIALIKPFKDLATSLFQADIDNVDFHKAEEAAAIINQWVEKQTNNKIKNLIKAADLNNSTRMILVNALHFLGKWSIPFDSKLTSTADFHTSKSSSKKTQMMLKEANFRYYECNETEAKYIELPYQDPRFTMTIVLPDDIEGLANLEKNMSQVVSPKAFQSRPVVLKVPKFTTESTLKLKNVLEMMGQVWRSETSDLSGISHEPLTISDVIQKAVINVNEGGTDVATETAVTGETAALLKASGQEIFNVDHPFCYFIKYKSIVLFIGKKIN